MTFTEAENKLKAIAKGEYCSLQFEKTLYGSGKVDTICRVYVHGKEWNSGHTWADAFQALEGYPIEHNPQESA